MGRARSFDNQDILERATRLFWRNGYNGTSMRELVEATGLAKASLYNAFGNKEEIFRSVLDYYIEQKQTRTLAPLNKEIPAREALITYFDNLVRMTMENHQTPGCLLINTATEQGIHDQSMRALVDRGMSRTEARLAQTVERGIKDGSIAKNIVPEDAGFCLVSVVVAIRVMARKGVERPKLEQLVRSNLDAHAPAPAQ